MATISLCAIAKNEQNNIARCIDSVKKYVDEVIVVDTGSSDKTVAIAENMGAKVFSYQWADDFAAARNFALDQASGDWIVFLDADEYFEPDKSVNLPAVVRKVHGNRKIDAVCILMKHMEKLGGPTIAHTQIVRLFRHSRSIRYQGRIHEAIFKQGRSPVVVYIPESTLAIRHTGYSQSTLPEKARRNLPLLEQEVTDHHTNCLTYYYLSQSHILLHQYDQAAQYALKSLENNKEILASTVHHKPYIFYIRSMIFLNEYQTDQVSLMVKEALQKYPDHPEILHCSGVYQLKLGHYVQALAFLKQALVANQNFHSTLDNEFPKVVGKVHEEIALVYDKMNSQAQCFDHTLLALQTEKHLVSAFSLLLSLVKGQKPADIVQLLDRMYDVRDKTDVEFLVRNLAILNQKQLFAHYLKILSGQLQGNYFIGMKFLVCDNFELAFQCFAALFRETTIDGAELFATIASILGDRPDWLTPLSQSTDSPLRRIALAYFQPQDMPELPATDFSAYSTLILNSINLASVEQLLPLLRISAHFPQAEALTITVDRLLRKHAYDPAFRFCCEQLQRTDLSPVLAGQLNVRAGFCCYKVRDFSHAADFFAQALKCTDSRAAAAEFLSWSHQQCHDPDIQRKIETIQTSQGPALSPTA
jgi:glycosyltransferase involved in cell wall biosynthesis